MTTRVLEGVRLSELARCPRMAALRGLGAEPAPPSDRARRWIARGQLFGIYAFLQFAEKHGRQNVEREREIPWACGTGHADVYVKPQRLIVEVVSSTSPDAIFAAKARQARLYLLHDPEAERTAVFVIDPSTLDREDLIPIVLRPDDEEELQAEIAAVQDALAGGPLPDCCAATPSECARSLFCPFTEQAWDGWTPAPPEPIEADADVLELLGSWVQTKTEEKFAATRADELHAERKAIEEQLAALDLPAKITLELGGYKVVRSPRAGRVSVSLAKARESGLWTPAHDELFAPFVKVSAGYDVWTITGSDDAPDLDFGDDPPF